VSVGNVYCTAVIEQSCDDTLLKTSIIPAPKPEQHEHNDGDKADTAELDVDVKHKKSGTAVSKTEATVTRPLFLVLVAPALFVVYDFCFNSRPQNDWL